MATPFIPAFLEIAFSEDFTHTSDGQLYKFYAKEICMLEIKEGKIIACDPFLYNDDKPFIAEFPIGSFPVELAIARINTDERVGFARIRFADTKPVRWEMAVREGQDVTTLNSDQIFGYGVDAGTGAFMDTSGGKELLAFLNKEYNNFQILIDEFEATYQNTRSWLDWKQNGSNAAFFSSGWGDGVYATYVGYDADDKICRLVTDFCVID
jgi:hypothetical protein